MSEKFKKFDWNKYREADGINYSIFYWRANRDEIFLLQIVLLIIYLCFLYFFGELGVVPIVLFSGLLTFIRTPGIYRQYYLNIVKENNLGVSSLQSFVLAAVLYFMSDLVKNFPLL